MVSAQTVNLAARTDSRVWRALDIIRTSPRARAREIAVRVNLSPSRLQHLFSRQAGVPLDKHSQNHWLERSASLLRSTEDRVKEIAASVGYSTSASFVRAFKAHYGETPMRYRRNNCDVTPPPISQTE